MRIVSLVVLAVFVFSAAAATEVPVPRFQSVALSNGGHVVVRYGAVQRVSVVSDPQYTRVRVLDGRLIIDRATRKCPRGYRRLVEVITPHLTSVSVSNGGTVQTVGEFPIQPSIKAAVEQGGTVDIRTVPVDEVDASVYSGGRIFTTSRRTLSATVESGGIITYWGNAEVRESVRDGGVVTRGTAEE